MYPGIQAPVGTWESVLVLSSLVISECSQGSVSSSQEPEEASSLFFFGKPHLRDHFLALHCILQIIQKLTKGQAPVAHHACNPSYSGGRDQDDWVQSQPRQIVLKTISKIPNIKQGLQSGSSGKALA
jgi:hypothetical protein